MISICEACAKSEGSGCEEHPLLTCSECGGQYVDDEDWSGPAHGPSKCIENLRQRVMALEDGIRKHRDSSGHDLCWYVPELWDLLPDKREPRPAAPPRAEFLERCAAYRDTIPEAPVPPAAVLAKLRAQGPERVKKLEEALGATLVRLEAFMDEGLSVLDEEERREELEFVEDMCAVLENR